MDPSRQIFLHMDRIGWTIVRILIQTVKSDQSNINIKLDGKLDSEQKKQLFFLDQNVIIPAPIRATMYMLNLHVKFLNSFFYRGEAVLENIWYDPHIYTEMIKYGPIIIQNCRNLDPYIYWTKYRPILILKWIYLDQSLYWRVQKDTPYKNAPNLRSQNAFLSQYITSQLLVRTWYDKFYPQFHIF